jgi:hypothetical protein
MRNRFVRVVVASLLGAAASCFVPGVFAEAAVVTGGILTSGHSVNGVDSTPDGISYTFTAVAGRHVTVAITNPKVSPSGDKLDMAIYDSSGDEDTKGYYFGTGPIEEDFTPTSAEAGTTTVIISPADSQATGSFTITYAKG